MEIFNDAGTYQITDIPVYQFDHKATFTFPSSTAAIVTMVVSTPAKATSIIVVRSVTAAVAFRNWVLSGVDAQITIAGTPSTSFEIYVFNINLLPPTNVGLQVFDGDGKTVYSSGRRHLEVVANVAAEPSVLANGATYSVNGPAGTKLGVVMFEMVQSLKSTGNPNVGNTIVTFIKTVTGRVDFSNGIVGTGPGGVDTSYGRLRGAIVDLSGL